MIDQDASFNGRTYREEPLGGTETAFVLLAESFVKNGHKVIALTKKLESEDYNGVAWKPLNTKINECDLYIINRAPSLLDNAPKSKRTILWVHNPASYLNKFRNFRRLIFKNIKVVCSGKYHFDSLPVWIKSRSLIIPLGLSEEVFTNENVAKKAPEPLVIFTSNPERGLLWLVDIWIKKIKVSVPNAKLHIFAGHKTYGGRNKEKIKNILNAVRDLNDSSIKLFEPIPKKQLFNKLLNYRAMLYKGDPGETFCLSVAEAQALGVPCVVKPIGSLGERVKDKITGIVAIKDEDFYNGAISILKEDKVWMTYRDNSLKFQRDYQWEKIAKIYANLIN
ncbi:MAG: glycosyltransferase [Alphaproteobacteria bacterium]